MSAVVRAAADSYIKFLDIGSCCGIGAGHQVYDVLELQRLIIVLDHDAWQSGRVGGIVELVKTDICRPEAVGMQFNRRAVQQ
ncbi:hypothetical protein D9M70_524250 [compost metagenome]